MAAILNKPDLLIIGAGMTGLSAGLTWALNRDARRHPVCILEKEPQTGGCVTTFVRRGYAFDTCQMISNLAPVFRYFGLDVPFKEFQGNFGRIALADPAAAAARIIELPSGEQRFLDHVCRRYPEAAKSFSRFFGYSRALFQEFYRLKYLPSPWELVQTLFACPKIVRHAGDTFGRYLARFGPFPPDVREILRVFTLMAGWPEDRVAAILPLGVMFSLLEKAFRPQGHFIDLPRQMERRFRELGGEVRTRCEVEKILVDRGRVRGARLRDGEVIEAEYVITTVDVKRAMLDLLGQDELRALDPGYARRVAAVQMTPSAMNISLGLDGELDLARLGFECGYTVLTTGGKTLDDLFAACARGETGTTETRFHVGVICPSLTTGGPATLMLSIFPLPLGEWQGWRQNDRARYRAEKERWADFYVGLVERHLIPGLRRHIRVRDVSTPATIARYTGSPTGSIYDMASGTDNFGLRRLAMRTPVHGLYQPKFAHGVFGTITGGMQAVDLILNRGVMQGNSRFPGS